MQSLSLHASLNNYAQFAGRKASPQFRALAKKVLIRDKFTCQYCGFKARQYQEIINKDNDFRNNALSNLLTACVFCAQCFFLESLGEGGYGGGTLIYCDKITQNDLNSFCHVLFYAIAKQTDYAESAQTIYQMLKLQSQFIEQHFGEGMSDPATFGRSLLDYQTQTKKEVLSYLKPIRLLPARGYFQKQLEAWVKSTQENKESS